MKKVLLIEPFYGGSHQQWCDGFQQYSKHSIEILSLPARHWKWRMHGAAVTLAQQFIELKEKPEVIVASDMLDLATFLGLTRKHLGATKVVVYFHENQLTYPWSPEDSDVQLKRDVHYAYINYTTALNADQIWFNSRYHFTSFIGELTPFLKQFPDQQNLNTVKLIEEKSRVLYLGMELPEQNDGSSKNSVPVILWNHRWEYDKNPEEFFEVLFQIKELNVSFQLILLGESYKKEPAIFSQAREVLKEEIIHFGYAPSYHQYCRLLGQADILPVTSIQDFFGGSIIEAINAGVYPLLPNRLAYPEHIPDELKEFMLYQNKNELKQRLITLLQEGVNSDQLNKVKSHIAKYNWSKCIKEYDAMIQNL